VHAFVSSYLPPSIWSAPRPNQPQRKPPNTLVLLTPTSTETPKHSCAPHTNLNGKPQTLLCSSHQPQRKPPHTLVLRTPTSPLLSPSQSNRMFRSFLELLNASSHMHPLTFVSAGAVIHSHAICSVLASKFLAHCGTEFRCTELEMIKGIHGHSYNDTLTVCTPSVIQLQPAVLTPAHFFQLPIIENTAHESDLADSLEAIFLPCSLPPSHARHRLPCSPTLAHMPCS
jgi:hypothetical protein